jgi:hypothetical protein
MQTVNFPNFSGVRCLMMPFIQGEPSSVPSMYAAYNDIISSVFFKKGDIGFLTIDESFVQAGQPHRGARAKFGRALHTEAGKDPNQIYCWGSKPATPTPYRWGSGGGWGKAPHRVTLDRDVKILLANNIDDSCAIWDSIHENTSDDGDIGHAANEYPYVDAIFLKAGEVHEIGILTPHESLPVQESCNRQFLRIISSGVYGREEYFTQNPLVAFA